ncbi:MAG: polymer-forming cytoskeletal protein [Candidatus Acidiferrales bacterium]|jgi:cytoskeletal protein CcmA (bactofilin family)
MWGEKKPAAPAKPTSNVPEPPTPVTPELYKPSTASAPPPVEARHMSPLETSYPATSSGATARLGQSLHFKGEISGNEDLHLDGSVEGLIHLEDRKLVIGASAKVTADVIAREVVVYGNVKGNLQARDRIEIKKDGSVVGDLTTARIMIEDGAYFKGSIEIEKSSGEAESSDSEKTFSRASKGSTTSSS